MNSAAGTTAPPRRAAEARRRWTRPALFLLAALLVGAAGYYAYDRYFKPQPVATASTQQATVRIGSIVATVSATGSVVPAQTAELGFGDESTGRLTELNVSVGDAVKAGDVLARLDTTDLSLELLKAESQLATAEANLETLRAGSSAAEIAQARAQLASAQATLDELRAGATATELQAVEADVATARANLAKAEATLTELRSGPSETERNNALIALEKARIALQNAQGAYDRVAWRPDAGASQEAMALWQATVDYQAAEAEYAKAMAGATEEKLAVAEQAVVSARAQLASAEAALAKLKEGPTPVERASAEAAVLQAQKQLDDALNPTTEAEIKAAEAAVEQAKIAVQSAKNNLEKATIVAPFDGVVAAVSGTIGQQAPSTVITLLDMSAPQVQITLAETDVAKVSVGQPATLTLEALGEELTLEGKVTAIAPEATVSSGVVTYTATVSIDGVAQPAFASGGFGVRQGAATGMPPVAQAPGNEQPGNAIPVPSAEQMAAIAEQSAAASADILAQIKPGMTASVSIEYLRKDDVLIVPNRAISAQGRQRVVNVLLPDGTTETRIVTVGEADDYNTEILSGLQQGDTVVYSTTATTTSTTSPGFGQQGIIISGDMPPNMPPGSPPSTSGRFVPR